MLSRNFKALQTPIIGRVIQLNKLVIEVAGRPIKRIQHTHCDTMIKDCSFLFLAAMRQLKGKEYKKRASELIEEIQSLNYLIYSLHGWSQKTALSIDVLCDDIASQMGKINNAGIMKSKDENE